MLSMMATGSPAAFGERARQLVEYGLLVGDQRLAALADHAGDLFECPGAERAS